MWLSASLRLFHPLPSSVCIGYLRYRVKPYIPQPMRCQKCQGYGHIAANCKRDVKCVRCGQGHSWENCPVKDDEVRLEIVEFINVVQ